MKRQCLGLLMELPKRLAEQLEGKEGPTRQKAARLVVDLARVAKAESFVAVDHAHVSGVSCVHHCLSYGDGAARDGDAWERGHCYRRGR